MTKQEFIQRFVIQNWSSAQSVFSSAEEAWTAIEGRLRDAPYTIAGGPKKAEWVADSIGDHEEAAKLTVGIFELIIDADTKRNWKAGLYTTGRGEFIYSAQLHGSVTQQEAKENAVRWLQMLFNDVQARLA